MPLTSPGLSRGERLAFAVLVLAPLTAAPAGQSCFAPVHGVFPTPCHPGAPECDATIRDFGGVTSPSHLVAAALDACVAERCPACG